MKGLIDEVVPQVAIDQNHVSNPGEDLDGSLSSFSSGGGGEGGSGGDGGGGDGWF